MPARLIILSAPSGAGKTSLARALVHALPKATLAVSHTTRERCEGEREGVDYYFVNRDEFLLMQEQEQFLESAEVFDYFYATSRDEVEGKLEQGISVVLDIDWQGARQVCAAMPEALSIFILPPSLDVLESRLRGRGRDPEAVIQRRMRDALAEIRHHDEYDFVVINDDFDAALADLVAIAEGREQERRITAADCAENLLATA